MESIGGQVAGAPSVKPRRLPEAVRQRRGIFTLALVAGVVIVALLATVPVPRASHFSLETTNGGFTGGLIAFSYGWNQSLCPVGAIVTVAFSSTVVAGAFGIEAPNGTLIWIQHSVSHANAAIALPTCGTYQIFVSGPPGVYTADGTVSYSSPVL